MHADPVPKQHVHDSLNIQVFGANFEATLTMKLQLPPFSAKLVRVTPLTSGTSIALKLEIFGVIAEGWLLALFLQ